MLIVCDYSEKIMRNLVEPEKKMITNNNATTAKRSMNAGTIKMSSKAGDDGSSNLLIGLPGQTNYQVSCVCSISNFSIKFLKLL